jgi:CRP/FNR family transcriptional regulator, cyclic AMP receptor protein
VPGESPVIIGTVGIGGLLGWSWLLPPYQWAFGAVCVTEVRAIEFRAEAVRDRCAADPHLGHELTRRMFQVLAGRLEDTRARLIARSVGVSS